MGVTFNHSNQTLRQKFNGVDTVTIRRMPGSDVFRFGFSRKEKNSYARFSTINKTAKRIYFEFSDVKLRFSYRLVRSSKAGNYQSISPTIHGDEAEVIKSKWIGRFKLAFDESKKLYYIDASTRVLQGDPWIPYIEPGFDVFEVPETIISSFEDYEMSKRFG